MLNGRHLLHLSWVLLLKMRALLQYTKPSVWLTFHRMKSKSIQCVMLKVHQGIINSVIDSTINLTNCFSARSLKQSSQHAALASHYTDQLRPSMLLQRMELQSQFI